MSNVCTPKWRKYSGKKSEYSRQIIESSSDYSTLVEVLRSIHAQRLNAFSVVDRDDLIWLLNGVIVQLDASVDREQNEVSEQRSNLETALNNLSLILREGDNHTINDTKASLNVAQTDKLIPIISSDLNMQVCKNIDGEIFKIAQYDPVLGIKNPNNIKESIISYKTNLFKTLQEFLGKTQIISLYNNLTEQCNIEEYSEIMSEVWKKLQSVLDETTGLYDGIVTNPQTSRMLEVFQAFYILNNFDTFIKNFAKKNIVVLENEFGTVHVSNLKYKLIEQHKKASSYQGEAKDHDADKELSEIFKVFWQTLQIRPGVNLTIKDLKKIEEGIKNSLNESHIDGTQVKESPWHFIINPNIKVDEMSQKIIQTLRSDKSLHVYLGAYGEKICKTIADSFSTFLTHYNEFIAKNNLTIDEKAELERVMHFPRLFKQSVINAENRVLVSYDENGNIKVESDSRLARSKEGLVSKIRKSIEDHVENGSFAIYSPTFSVNTRGLNIFSKEFINFFNDLTGLRLSKAQLERFAADEQDVEKLFNFIDQFTYLVQTELRMPLRFEYVKRGDNFSNGDFQKRVIDKFFKKLKIQPFYLDFSNIYIRENRNDVINLMDQNGHSLPILINPNTIGQFAKNLEVFKNQLGIEKSKFNILSNYPDLTAPAKYTSDLYTSTNAYREHIGYRQDVAYMYNNRKQVIKAVEMSPEEILTTAFCGEFFDSILNQGTFYNQVDCYSDKVTIALAAYNARASIRINGQDKTFMSLTSDELYDLWKKQKAGYYLMLKESITNDLNKVFGTNEDFESLIARLENTKTEDFERLVSEYNIAHPGSEVDIVQEIHYAPVKNDNCAFNNSLYFNIKESESDGKNLDRYYNEALQDYKESLVSIRIPKKYQTEEFIETHKQDLLDLFNLDDTEENVNKLKHFFKIGSQEDVFWIQEGNELSDRLVDKYFAMQALCTEAELQITNKENIIHNGKVKQMSISKAYDASGNITEEFYNHMKLDLSERLIVGKKRNNSQVASYLPMDTCSTYGVGARSRFAVVKSKKQDLMNYNLQRNNGQDVVDGSLETIGIAVVWENHSYPGKKVENTKKVIGLIPTKYGFLQFKCADFALDNIRILESHQNLDEHSTNVRVRAQKMMQTGVFKDNFFEAFKSLKRTPIGVNIFKYFGNQLLSLTSMEVIEGHKMHFTWTSPEPGNDTVLEQDLEINNVYDLWEMMGAEYTVEQQDGTWKPSNSSMTAIAHLISEYAPDIKQSMTSKIVDVSSNKSGITNINLIEDVDDPNKSGLNTILIDNARWGMQQDYSHESDESHIPSLSQVISAVAFNGKNIRLVEDMYDTLATLTMLKARELGIRHKGDAKSEFYFHKRLVEKLLSSLSTGATRSDALTLTREAKDVIDEIVKQHNQDLGIQSEDGALLPYSSPDIFYKLSSDIISDLNKKSIRLTFPGIAIIQNPSHSEVGLYEDNQGKIYKKYDLLQAGRRRGVLADGVTPINLNTTEEEIIESALADKRFQSGTIVKSNELKLNDWVQFKYSELNELNEPVKKTIVLQITDLDQLSNLIEKKFVVKTKNEEVIYTIESDFVRLYDEDVNSLELEDWVSFKYENDFGEVETKTLRITDPGILFELSEGIYKPRDEKGKVLTKENELGEKIEIFHLVVSDFTKLYGKTRDLKAPKVYFYTGLNIKGELIGYQSLWLTEAVKNRYEVETRLSNLKGQLKKAESDRNVIEINRLSKLIREVLVELKSALLWYRANLEGLGNEKPYYYATLQDFEASRLQTELNPDLGKTFVYGVTFVPGEQMIPKVHKSAQMLGSTSMRDIIEYGASYFYSLVKYKFGKFNTLGFLDSNLLPLTNESESILTIARTTDEIVYTPLSNHPELTNEKRVFNPNIINQDGIYYYQNNLGKIICAVPSLNSKIYTDSINGKPIYYIVDNALSTDIISCVENTEGVNAAYESINSNNIQDYRYNRLTYNYSINTNENVEKLLKDLAVAMSDSFNLSNYTISARIPSQSFQSFMANKTAAFMEGDQNNGYINIFEMWFLGSDYDIDKAYTMMYGLSKSGLIATVSPIYDLTSHKTLTKSLQLPLPNKQNIIKYASDITGTDVLNSLTEIATKYGYIKNPTNEASTLSQIWGWLSQVKQSKEESSRLMYLSVMLEMLELLNSVKNPILLSKQDFDSGLINMLNKHNEYRVTAEGLKNRIMNTIYQCSSDIKNLEASSQPMDSKSIKDLIDEIELERGTQKKIYNNINPFTKYEIQYENSVGKKNVGIAANGVKGAAAIQQYYNTYYQQWKSGEIDPNYAIDLNLQFNEVTENGIRDIYTDLIFTVGDTVISFELFKELSTYVDDNGIKRQKDFSDTSDYKAIYDYLNDGELLQESHDHLLGSSKRRSVYYNKQGKLKSQYDDLITSWKLFVKQKGYIVNANNLQDVWVEFLYYKRQFNPNVADMISIFISLATDNAKELVLARINATPELMSIPITMLTLGIPPKQVLEVCIICLDPIAKKLRSNKLQSAGTKDVKRIIESTELTPEFDSATRLSLLKIYNAAQEMRAITSFFKINQGLTAQYVELLNFYKNLAATLPKMVKRNNPNAGEVDPINLELLFSDKWENSEDRESYITELNSAINNNKSAFNVIDIVLKNKNFSAMLKAMQLQMESIHFAAGAAKFVNIRSIIEAESENQVRTDNYRVLLRLYQDFIIGKTLQSDTFAELMFDLLSISKSLGINPDDLKLPHKTNAQFGLNTEAGIENFVYLIENYLIPLMKDKYKDNFFIKSLEEVHNKQLDKTVYQLMYNVFDDEDVSELLNVLNAVQDLKKIGSHHSGLETVFGRALTISDLFYLYDTIVHKQRMSGLDTVVKAVANQRHSKLSSAVNDMFIKYDNLARTNEEQFKNEFTDIDLIQQAVLNGYTASDRLENGSTKSINLKGKYIWTFTEPTVTSLNVSDLFEPFLKSKLIKELQIIPGKNLSGESVVTIIPYIEIGGENFLGKLMKIKSDSSDISMISIESNKYNEYRDYLNMLQRQYVTIESMSKELFDTHLQSVTASQYLKDILSELYLNENVGKITLRRPNTIRSGILDAPFTGYVSKNSIDSTTIVLGENTSEYELLDLLLEVHTNSKSAQVKYAKLNEVLKKKLETLTSTKDKRKISLISLEYLTHLSTIYPEHEIVKKCAEAQDFINLYLSDKDVFYDSVLNKEHKTLLPGDIVVFIGASGVSPKVEYVYVGNIQGKEVFLDSSSGKIKSVLPELSNGKISNMSIKYLLRVPFGYYPSTVKFVPSGNIKQPSKCNIQEQDRISTESGDFIVNRVLYKKDSDGSYNEMYLAYDQDAQTLSLIWKSEVQLVEKSLYNSSKLDDGTQKNVYTINEQFESSTYILKHLQKGDSVYVASGEDLIELPFMGYINETTIKAGTDVYKIDEIYYVSSYNTKYYDSNFEHDIQPTSVYLSNKSSALIQYLKYYNGWEATNVQTNKRGDVKVMLNQSTNFKHQGKLVYNLQGYSQVSQPTVQLDDMFLEYNEDGKAETFIKITDIQEDIYEVLMYKDGHYSLEYCDLDELKDFTSNLTHYSKSLFLPVKSETLYELSDIAKGSKILEFLHDQIGLDIVFEDIEHAAQIRNNQLVINSKYRNDISRINYEAIHEFTHLAIAMLRMKDPDSYVSMINYFQDRLLPVIENITINKDSILYNTVEKADQEFITFKTIFDAIDNDEIHYPTTSDKIEEKIIKYLDYYRGDLVYTVSELSRVVNSGFNILFGGDIETDRSDTIIKRLQWMSKHNFNKKSLFEEASTGINMLELAKREQRKHILNKIIEKCY